MIKDRYGIIVVVGNRENGKTTFMARHIKRELNLFPVYKKGYSNIKFRDSPEVTFTNYAGMRLLNASNPKGIPDMILGIDQLHKYADARRSGSRENVEFCDTMIESRQHGFDSIGTTWAMSSIDPRIRKFVELWVLAERKANGFHYTYTDPDRGPIGELTIPYSEAEKIWRYFSTIELVEDETLSDIAHVNRNERMDLAKELAVYEPCGGKKVEQKIKR